MKIIAIVNGGFAIPTLRSIVESRHSLIAVFVMPIRTKRSGHKAGIPPIREALSTFLAGIPFFELEDINSSEGVELLKQLEADLFFICDYGRILSKDVIKATKYGGVNLHGSLLPKFRGAAPINRAIQAGERELGVSVIFIEPEVDAGPVVSTASYYPSQEDTALEIEKELAVLGAPLVLDVFDQIESGKVIALPQNSNEATQAPKIKKEEGRIDWNRSSIEIINQYRAFQPWPRVYSDWLKSDKDGEKNRLILGPFSELDEKGEPFDFAITHIDNVKCGTVIAVSKSSFWIKTGDGVLRPLTVQPNGKKSMETKDFLRGYAVKPGDFFE